MDPNDPSERLGMSRYTMHTRSVRTTRRVDVYPPTQEEMTWYRKRNLNLLRIPSLISFGCLIVSQIRFGMSEPGLWWVLVAASATLLYFLVSQVVALGTKDFDFQAHEELVQEWVVSRMPGGAKFGTPLPHLAVFLPICGEPIGILRETWRNVHALAEEYKLFGGILNAYVGDDGASDEARDLAAKFPSFTYLRRPETGHNKRGTHKKSGNLLFLFENGYKLAGRFRPEPYFFIFDADFCPNRAIIKHTVPYMERGEADPRGKVGIVQTPQFFRTSARYNPLQRMAGGVQELFYRQVQVTRDNHDASICVGSNALYRREALDTIGGSAKKEDSEDVWTGFLLRRNGWRLQYVPIPLATGLCPADLTSFILQQYRWCKGSVGGLLPSKEFRETKLPLVTRLCYVSGFMYYVHTAAFTFLAPLVPLVLVGLTPSKVSLLNALLVLPSLVYNMGIFPLWHKSRYNPVYGLAVRMIYGWAHAFCLTDLLRRRPVGWRPTGASATKSKTRWYIQHARWVIGGWGFSTGLLWTGLAVLRMFTFARWWDFIIPLFTGLFYLIVTFAAVTSDQQAKAPIRGSARS